MKFFSRLFERRSSLGNPSRELLRLFDGGSTAAGISVSAEKAMTHPAVFGCVRTLKPDVAKTPTKLRRKVADGAFEDAVDHPLFEILHALPNPEQSAFEFKAQMMESLLLHGQAFAQVVRMDGRVTALWPLDARQMRVDRDEQRRKRYTYTTTAGTQTWTFDASQPPVFELTFDTPLHRCREIIGTALALQTYVGKFFANGARPAGALMTPQSMPELARKSLRESWQAAFGGAERAHRVAILDGDLKYQPFASPNDESQLNETLQSLRMDIAGCFRVPLWKIGDPSKTSYSNMETGAIEYVTGTLDPYFTAWEHAIRRDLLTVRQYNQFDVIFDRQALLRSDVKALHDALATGRQAGFYSANDCRRFLGLNPIEGGDEYLVNSALVPVANAGEPEPDRSTANLATRRDLDDLALALGVDRAIHHVRAGRDLPWVEPRLTAADDADLKVE